MRLTEFPGHTVVLARDQPQFRPMPAHLSQDGIVTCCWRLGFLERLRVLLHGEIWHQIMTHRERLQPQSLTVRRPAEVLKVHSCNADSAPRLPGDERPISVFRPRGRPAGRPNPPKGAP
jgi:hypothetical protein